MRVVILMIVVAVLVMGDLSKRASDALDPMIPPEAAVRIHCVLWITMMFLILILAFKRPQPPPMPFGTGT